jgi:hypothetical protein
VSQHIPGRAADLVQEAGARRTIEGVDSTVRARAIDNALEVHLPVTPP